MADTEEQIARKAAEEEFGERLVDSLTNDQSNWSLMTVFDRERMVHATNGMQFYYPLEWLTVNIVDGPSIRLANHVQYTAIIARVGEIKAKNETAKLDS